MVRTRAPACCAQQPGHPDGEGMSPLPSVRNDVYRTTSRTGHHRVDRRADDTNGVAYTMMPSPGQPMSARREAFRRHLLSWSARTRPADRDWRTIRVFSAMAHVRAGGDHKTHQTPSTQPAVTDSFYSLALTTWATSRPAGFPDATIAVSRALIVRWEWLHAANSSQVYTMIRRLGERARRASRAAVIFDGR